MSSEALVTQEDLEEQELAKIVRQSRNEPVRPFAEVVQEMLAADEIDAVVN